MKTITYSAPAKVILSGEHAVVYGKPAFVTAIDIRLTVAVAKSTRRQGGKLGEIAETVRTFAKKNGMNPQGNPCRLTVSSAIPVGRGLGSSAALSVASSAALLEFFTGKEAKEETVNNCAYAVEKIFHTNPSGVDTTASCYGGLIFFRKEFDFLKTISKLHMKIPQNFSRNMLLIDSGKPRETTATMVGNVGKKYNNSAAKTDAIFGRIEKSTKRFVVACMTEDRVFFGQSIMQNQKELEELEVVSSYAKDLLIRLKRYGIGKVTGAGGLEDGSGYILFLADDKIKAEEYLNKNRIPYLLFTPTLIGVRKEL